MRIIANVHQIPNYLTDTRTLCKTFNILPLLSLLVYFNSIYGYQIFNNSVPDFVSNLFMSVNNRYPLRDVFKLNPCNDINTMIYQFLFVQWQDYPVLNAIYLNMSSHLYSVLLLFFSHFCFGTKCKTFCLKWFRLPNKVLKKEVQVCGNLVKM